MAYKVFKPNDKYKVVIENIEMAWISSTLPSSTDWQSVTYGNGKFVAAASGSTKAAYSTDAIKKVPSIIKED